MQALLIRCKRLHELAITDSTSWLERALTDSKSWLMQKDLSSLKHLSINTAWYKNVKKLDQLFPLPNLRSIRLHYHKGIDDSVNNIHDLLTSSDENNSLQLLNLGFYKKPEPLSQLPLNIRFLHLEIRSRRFGLNVAFPLADDVEPAVLNNIRALTLYRFQLDIHVFRFRKYVYTFS